MKSGYLCLVFAACFAVGYSRDLFVNTTSQLDAVMKTVQPGDTVNVAAGFYRFHMQDFPWMIQAKGLPDKPITLLCERSGLCEIFDQVDVGASSYFTISGFKIGNSYSDTALGIFRSDHIALYGLYVNGGKSHNAWVTSTSSLIINQCTFLQTQGNSLDIVDSSEVSVKYCTFREWIGNYVALFRNTTKSVFTDNEIYGGPGSYKDGGSWIVEMDSGGNEFSYNQFGFSFSWYQRTLNGYLAKGTCQYGPSILKRNFMDLNKGTGFAGCKVYNNKVCASNVVAGATFTDGDIDKSC